MSTYYLNAMDAIYKVCALFELSPPRNACVCLVKIVGLYGTSGKLHALRMRHCKLWLDHNSL